MSIWEEEEIREDLSRIFEKLGQIGSLFTVVEEAGEPCETIVLNGDIVKVFDLPR